MKILSKNILCIPSASLSAYDVTFHDFTSCENVSLGTL